MSERAKILVVDDQREILDLTATVLDSAGFRTATSGSGHEALARLAGEPFDLVLLDINMPGMDGWETLRLLRADEQLARMPVVMFSVKGEICDKVHSLQEGAAGYVTKPFIVDDLIARIEQVLAAAARGPGSAT
jgi:DNA-binding response OmpR family regulator